MSTLTPEQWQVLSPYLDQALTLSGEERARWLESLRKENPVLAGQIHEFLERDRAAEDEGLLDNTPIRRQVSTGLAGQTVGAYRLISAIGHGGMGTVWLAERNDGRFERKAAVKFLNAGLVGRGGEEGFKREGAILARLNNPNIAELLDAGVTAGGQPYLILEYVEGEPIDRYCDERKLDVRARIRLFLDVLAAVAHAHSNLIVHRDIKPSNVLVNKDGQVKLLDFGIAKLLQGEGHEGAATLLTREGGSALTPEYAAPEQVKGGPVTTATDVYALGVLLYVLLTGQHPAGVGPHSPADLLRAITDTDPRRPSDVVSQASDGKSSAAKRGTVAEKLCRQLRGDLDTVIAKTLKKNPLERYASVTALADDLGRFLRDEPIRARPDTMAYRAAKFVRRNRTAVALATVAAVATLAGLAGTIMQSGAARRQRDFAQTQRDFAFRQLARAEALNEFQQFILSDAAPSGKPFTVNELLERAEHILARQHTATDANRVELLVSIGQQYSLQDEDAKARRVLEEAYARSQHLSEETVRARASCGLANAVARDGEAQHAEALYQEGLRYLPDAPQFAATRAECLHTGSEVAWERGDLREGVARIEAARQVLRESNLNSDWTDLLLLVDLGEAHRMAGDNYRAIATFQQASQIMTSLGRDETQSAAVMFNDWALALEAVGQPLEAEKLYRRAIDISRAGETEESVAPMLLNNYAVTLRQLERLREAADYAERAYSQARRAGSHVVAYYSLGNRILIYLEQHDYARATVAVEELQATIKARFASNAQRVAVLASLQSLLAAGRGNYEAALSLADNAVSLLEANPETAGDLLPIFLIRRSSIALEARRVDRAAGDASRALILIQSATPNGAVSSYAGKAYLNLGLALRAQNQPDKARDAFRNAAANLQATLGTHHSDTRRAQKLAALEAGL